MQTITNWETLHKAIRNDLQSQNIETEGRQGVINYILTNDIYLANEFCTTEAHKQLNTLLTQSLNYIK